MFNNYTLNDVSQIETPEFLIFESKVESNIDSIISLVGDKKRLLSQEGQLVSPWAQSINLTATAAMGGADSWLTGGNTRFCRESSKCHNRAGFGR